MGADLSTYKAPLVPQAAPICASDQRFCLSRSIQLRIREKVWSSGGDYKITDPSDGTVHFTCTGRAFSLRNKKTLMDPNGVALMNMKEKEGLVSDTFIIYAQNSSEKIICTMKTEWTFAKAKLIAHFTDLLTNDPRILVLKGDSASKTAVIYLGEPKQNGVPIGKVFRPLTGRSFLGADEYLLEVTPGVDIALLVMMCIALDECDT